MTQRMERFCREYAACRDSTAAALRAGYRKSYAAITGRRLLSFPVVEERLKELAEGPRPLPNAGGDEIREEDIPARALAALRRLAFEADGPALEAMLLSAQSRPADFARLDLFRVSEASLSGDGKLTFKFYDRFRAIQMLLELAGRAGGGAAGGLLRAIEASVAALPAEVSDEA